MSKKNFMANGNVANLIKKAADNNASANTDNIKEIGLDKIIENQLNKFSMKEEIEFELLKVSIQRTGVMQPVILKRNEDDTYTIIAGHRRTRASKAIGKKTIPAVIKNYDADGIDEALDLIETNLSARKISVDDIIFSIKELENIIKNKNVKIEGKVSDYIGNILNISGKQVERYKALSNLIPELKEKVDNKELGMSSVTGLANMPKEQQETALNEIIKTEEETGKPVSREQTKEIKKAVESVENLIPELKEKIENKELDIKSATELSALTEEQQKTAHEEIKKAVEETGKPVTVEQSKDIKKDVKNIEKLIPELKEKVVNKEIDVKSASELSELAEDKQKEAHKVIEKSEKETGKPVTIETTKEIKRVIENPSNEAENKEDVKTSDDKKEIGIPTNTSNQEISFDERNIRALKKHFDGFTSEYLIDKDVEKYKKKLVNFKDTIDHELKRIEK